MRLQRFALWVVVIVSLLVAVAAVALHVASRSESLLRWGIAQVSPRLPCVLQVEGLRGSLVEPLRIERVVCENERVSVEARDVAFDWTPWLLRHKRLEVSRLRIAELDVTLVPREKPRPPEDLQLPLLVRVASVEIGEITVRRRSATVELQDLRAAYHGDANVHAATVHGVGTQWGRFEGEATIGTRAPLPLGGRLTVDSAYIEGWPLAASIAIHGELRAIAAQIEGSAGEVPFDARLELALFEDDPVRRVTAHARGVDLRTIDARLPHTAFEVAMNARGQGWTALSGTLHANNTEPGSIDRERLPLHALEAAFAGGREALRLSEAKLDMGAAGNAAGSVGIEPGRIELALDVRDLDLRAIHSRLRSTRLAGSIGMNGEKYRQRIKADLREGDLQFEGEAEIVEKRVRVERLLAQASGARLQANGTLVLAQGFEWSASGELRSFDPARFGDFPSGRISGRIDAQGRLQPEWLAQMRYALDRSRFMGQPLSGRGKLTLSPGRFRDADAQIALGGNTLHVSGGYGHAGDGFDFRIDAPRLAALDERVTGRLQAVGRVSGTPARPALDVTAEAHELAFDRYRVARWGAQAKVEQAEDPRLNVRLRMERLARGDLELETVSAEANGSLSAHAIEITASGEHIELSGALEGGWDSARKAWSGVIARLQNGGDFAFRLTQPARVDVAADRVLIGETGVHFQQTDIALEETRLENGELSAAGSIAGVRAARLLELMDEPPEVETSLLLRGRWSIRAGDSFDGLVELARVSGDVVIPGDEPLPLELSEVRLDVRAQANRLTARGVLKGRQLDAQARAETVLERRGARWGVAGTAPLQIEARAEIGSIRPLAALLSPAVSADGRLKAQLRGDGTVAQPALQGTLEGAGLAIENVENGIFLHEGTLLAELADGAIALNRFDIRGGEGSFSATGRLARGDGGPRLDLEWKADRLAVVQHPDLRLTVSGAGKVGADDRRLALSGELRADQGRVELRSQNAPALGGDVVVAGREERIPVSERVLRSDLDLKLDLGPDFQIAGRGLNAQLAGSIRLVTAEDATLAARGEISVARGTFEAYGQRLSIDRGKFYFSGPVDNPGLEIRAMRKNQAVEAGVEVTGTARNPSVRLVSEPDVPDPEKLSWLVLGRRVEAGDTGDAQQLQSSAAALAAGLGTAPLQLQLARAVGVDELRVAPAADGTQGGVVTVGKRISDRIYVSNERSLATATDTLRVSYQLSKRWAVRTESGPTDAVDLFYTIFFD
ncbi:MAG: translocation/assembly module TamB domain-containing protein [Burkholderiales bacterium]